MELVGRGAEVGALHTALDRAVAGRRTVVAVRGEAGIGKTSLLVELRAEAAGRGAAVLTTAVTDVETSIGWAGLATLLRGAGPAIEQLPEAQREALLAAIGHGGSHQVEPLAVAAALAELLRGQAEHRPLAVIVDDVHWLDSATAGALSFVIRLHSDVPILFVLAARAARIPLDLARLVDAATPDDLIVVEPGRLSVGAIYELLDERFGLQLGRVDLVRFHDLTGGNPLHVIETGRLLAAGTPLTDALMPASLAGVVDMQLERLDDAHLPVLQAAALMPTIDVDLLTRLHPGSLVDAAIMQAESIEVIHVSDDELTFRHPLIQAGLARRLNTLERRSLHRRLASLSDEPDVIALHLSEAAHGVDETAAELLEAAAEVATLRGLPVQAARDALRSYELTDPTNAGHRSRRRLLAARAAFEAGDPRRTLDLLLPVADGDIADRDDHRAGLRLIAIATAAVAGGTASVPWIERLVLESPPDSRERARAIIMLSRALLFQHIPSAALAAEDAVAAATASGSTELVTDATAARSVARFLSGFPVDVDREVSLASSQTTGDTLTASSMLGEMLVWSDRLDEAVTVLHGELEAHDSSGAISGTLETTSQLIDVGLRSGDLGAARSLTERSLTLASAAGWEKSVVLRSAELAVLSALQCKPHQPIVDRIEVDRSRLSSLEVTQLDATLGYASLLAGSHAPAAQQLRAAHETAETIGLADLGALPYCGNLVEALVTIGAIDEATRVAASMASTAARTRRGRAEAEALRARAMVVAAVGDLADADVAAMDAVAAFEQLPLPIEHGRALLLAGSIARRRKQRARAGELLRAGDARFISTGAVAYSRRVHAELDRLGSPTTSELTATESQIADLVVAGRRNDEIAAELFVTRRTVEANLTRVYRKLGVRSRTELAARLRSS